MKTNIALFRGINVGGRHLLPMKDLVSIMEDCGCSHVRTYIQSGNVVFSSSAVSADRIVDQVAQRKGFRPEVLILDLPELELALNNNPFKKAEGKALHFSFCKQQPESVDIQRLNELKSVSEEFAFEGRVFYLHAPDGIGRSKLAGQVERCLGVPVTGRNLNTVRKLVELARGK